MTKKCHAIIYRLQRVCCCYLKVSQFWALNSYCWNGFEMMVYTGGQCWATCCTSFMWIHCDFVWSHFYQRTRLSDFFFIEVTLKANTCCERATVSFPAGLSWFLCFWSCRGTQPEAPIWFTASLCLAVVEKGSIQTPIPLHTCAPDLTFICLSPAHTRHHHASLTKLAG